MPEPLEETSAAWRARAHRTALNFNWDYGCAKLLEIIRRQFKGFRRPLLPSR